MASITLGPPEEEGELPSSPIMPQPVIPGLGPHPHIPRPRPRPPTIPAPPAQPAPEKFAGHIQRSFPDGPVRPPFLWGVEVNALGQGAFGTVILVHQTVETDLWGARKFGVLPESAKISKSSNIPPNPPLTICSSTAPIPSGRSTTYSRGRVISIKTMSWRPLTRA